MRSASCASIALFAACVDPGGAAAPRSPSTVEPPALHLDRVVLYQNGIGHFERAGHLDGDRLRLRLRTDEVDDVIKTLTVIDASGEAQQVAAVLPTPSALEGDEVEVEVVLSRPGRDLHVSYAVPTATWKTTYRLALPDGPGGRVLLQSWAMIDNLSTEPWERVSLALATGAPLSYVTDLRSVHFVPRPRASVDRSDAVIAGPIHGEASRADRDGDDLADASDACADAPEDLDAIQDLDGCPEVDADHDGIADDDDRCPIDAEVYNGDDDEDGCPDDGRALVMVEGDAVVITDKVYFDRGQASVSKRARGVVDAVGTILKVHTDLRVRIEGHAASDDRAPDRVARERAEAVRVALARLGVSADRLEAQGFGVERPLVPGRTPDANERNRRVEFTIIKRREEPLVPEPPRSIVTRPLTPPSGPRLDAPTLAASASISTLATEVAGSTRYQLGDRVTIPARASSLVSVLNREVGGEEILLFRPDPAAPASAHHPFRAGRVELPAELVLEPGPVAVFAGGGFAGEGMLARTHGGEVSYVPFAIDGGTRVDVDRRGAEAAQRLLTVARGVATVENAVIQETRYTIVAGAQARGRIFLRHALTPGLTLGAVPPGTERTDGALLVPVVLTAGKTATLTIEERRPVERRLQLLDDATDLAAYLEGAHLSPAVQAQAQAVVDARAALAVAEQAVVATRDQIEENRRRVADLEDSLATTAELRGPGALALRKRLIASLTSATADADRMAGELAAHIASAAEARAELQAAIAGLGLEMSAPSTAGAAGLPAARPLGGSATLGS